MQTKSLLLTAVLLTAAACSDDLGDEITAVDPTPPIEQVESTPATSSASTPATTAASSDSTATPLTTAAGPIATASTTTDAAPGSTSTMTEPAPEPVQPLYDDGDIDRGLQPFVDQARDDLAERLDVDPPTISVRAAVLVVWPDSSLGCPQPGMSYAQANVDGSVIELVHDGDVYRYHTGGSEGPFICEKPIDKRPPTETEPLRTIDVDAGRDD